jgi:signal peptidase I
MLTQVTSLQELHGAKGKPEIYTERGYELSLGSLPLRELLIGALNKGASFRFRAKGFSMSPFIKDSDVVTVAPISTHNPRIGDVVVFGTAVTEELVIHRVVGRKDTVHFFIKGDNLPTQVHLVPKSQILGRVQRVERNGKTVALGLGPERRLIALLSRRGLLLPLLLPLWRSVRPFLRRFSW